METITHSWSEDQVKRLNECLDNGDTIAFWCSDAKGQPCNGGTTIVPAETGDIISLKEVSHTTLCTSDALHGTLVPNEFVGPRVWVCAFRHDVKKNNNKVGAITREYLGEILASDSILPSISARLGEKNLSGASLPNSRMFSMDLNLVDFRKADLTNSKITKCNLAFADFRGATLTGVNFEGCQIAGTTFDEGALEALGFDTTIDGIVIKSNKSLSILEKIGMLFNDIFLDNAVLAIA